MRHKTGIGKFLDRVSPDALFEATYYVNRHLKRLVSSCSISCVFVLNP